MKDKRTTGSWRTAWECLLAIMGMAVLTLVSFRLHAGPAMAALLFFFLVVLISLWAGFLSTAFACAVAALCYVYFFTQPLYHLWMTEPVEIAATMVFSGTALIISRLLARVRERTAEVQQTNEQLQSEIAERQRAEEKIRQSEAELQNVIESIPVMAFTASPDGCTTFRNRGWREYTGLPPQDTEGFGWQTAIHPEDKERHMEKWRRCSARGEPSEDEARFRRAADGEYRWFLFRAVPRRDETGKILSWYGVLIDIEDRKQAAESLHRLNRELRALSNCNQTLLRATDEQSLLHEICRIVCEEAGYRVAWVGYAEHDEAKSVRPVAWTGTEEGDVANLGITWADTERGRGIIGTAIRSGKTCCIKDYATDPEVAPWRESALQHGFRSAIALPLKDEHANIFGSLNIYSAQPNAFTSEEVRLLEELAADLSFGVITLRSRAARERAEQEVALLSFAVDRMREAAFLMDDRGRFQYVNEEACNVLGYTRAQLLGMGVADIDPEFPAERWPDHWRDLQAQRSLSFESRHRTRDGHTFPVEVSANYFEYGGRAYNLAFVRDITERKRAEEALRRSEAYLASAQKLIHTGAYAMNGTSREPIYWSEEMFRLFGTDPKEGLLKRDQVWQRIHPKDHDKVKEASDSVFLEKVDSEVEYRIVLPDGTVKLVHTQAHPVLSASGEVAEVVATMVDITERNRAEGALKRSEAYLAESQKLTQTGSWAWDPRTDQMVYCSEEVFRIYGLDPRHGVPTMQTLLARVHQDDRARVRTRALEGAREGAEHVLEYRLLLPDGTVKYIRSLRQTVLNASGEVIEVLGTAMDITERKRAEEELRESETRFRTFVDHAADALFIYDFEQGTIIDVNRQACESLGYTRQELMGATPLAFDRKVDRAVRESMAERTSAGETVIDTHWHQRKDGTLFPVEAHTSQYWYGGRRFLLKIARDITDRKRAEEELRRSEAYLAEGQRLTHTGSFAWSPATRQSIYWSEEMLRIFGFNPQEGVPSEETFWQRIHPEDLDRTRELLLKAALGNMEYEHDHRILLPDGTVKHIHAIGHPVLDEKGQVAKYVGTAVDVTERKRAERERERLRQLEAELAHIDRISMMGELAASVAHEVNQPLSGVVVNANACLRWLALGSPNLEEAREAVRRIVRDGKRAGEVIARIRALATKTATAKERLNMNEAIREVTAFAQDGVRKNRVTLRIELADALSPVLGDRVQLQQVVLNLVMNGIEAMSGVEERPRELIVRTQNDDEGQVRVTVQDSGIGLDAQSLERIFDAFYTTKRGGMGMGLSISRSIIQNHGGKLWAVANEGPGISVQFTIPKYQ